MPDELPPHVKDQVDAASRDNLAFIKAVADASGFDSGSVKAGDDAGFDALRERVAEAIVKHRTRSCTHLKSPQPTFIRAWDKPLRLMCARCATRAENPKGDEEFRCDICGVVERDGFQVQHAEAGPFYLAFGRCRECFETKRASI